MAQAYPQFTPVQILEAGQRAVAEGRSDYAAQFFQHLIDHYGETPEAAGARDAMVRLGYGAESAPSISSGANGTNGRQPRAAQPNGAHNNGHAAAPGYAPQTAPNGSLQGVQLNGNNGHDHHANGAGNGYGHASPQVGQPETMRNEPTFSRPAPAPELSPAMPRHIARHAEQPAEAPSAQSDTLGLYIPAPEKHYIIGRVISGLLLLIGILGIFAGIVLLYAAISDPSIYGAVGIPQPAQALLFAGSVFIGSLLMLIASQMATALFDTADSTADLARLERYRMGDYDDEEDEE